MTLPGGIDNVTIPANQPSPLFPKSGPDGNPLNSGYSLTQTVVQDSMKQAHVVDNPAVQNPKNALYDGLSLGLGLPLGIINAIAGAFTGATGAYGSVGAATNDIRIVQGGFADQITEHTEAIANLEDVIAAMGTTQAYVGDLQDMVTDHRSKLVAATGLGEKSVIIDQPLQVILFPIAPVFILTYAMPTIKPTTQLGTSTGHIYYTPIVVDRVGTIDKMRWIVGADTAIYSVDYYEMALCIYNPANGRLEKVWGSGNIKDGVANTTSMREVELDMGIDQATTPGQILFVAHQQTASGLGQEARTFAAVPQGNIGRPAALLLDAACYTAPAHSQGIPSSIVFDSLTKENRYIPWSAVSVNTTPVTP